jgi:RimJ/RimL family protein N-acetyltransferase
MEFIGWYSLKYDLLRDEIDLGYRIIQKHWRQGHATEAAFACVQYGFEKLNLRTIVGKAGKENKASIRVLRKCGMLYTGVKHIGGYPMETYAIHNPSFPK